MTEKVEKGLLEVKYLGKKSRYPRDAPYEVLRDLQKKGSKVRVLQPAWDMPDPDFALACIRALLAHIGRRMDLRALKPAKGFEIVDDYDGKNFLQCWEIVIERYTNREFKIEGDTKLPNVKFKENIKKTGLTRIWDKLDPGGVVYIPPMDPPLSTSYIHGNWQQYAKARCLAWRKIRVRTRDDGSRMAYREGPPSVLPGGVTVAPAEQSRLWLEALWRGDIEG